MQHLSQVLKQSYLLLDAASTEPTLKKMCQKLLLSPIPSMQQRRFLIVNHIHTKFIPQSFLASCVNSSISIRKTLLNSENVLVVSNRDSIKMSTRIQNHSIQHLFFLVKSLGIIARKLTVTISSTSGR